MSSPATLAFDSIASLRGYTGTVSEETIQLLGYYNPADGGGGEFYWNSTSTATDDGGSVIKVTGVTTGRWIRVFETPQISVKAFGAVGNDSTDDSASINAAATYCGALVNSTPSTITLYLPNATAYLVKSTIVVPPYVSVWMESFLNLNDLTFSNTCLQIGTTATVNSALNCRIMVHNQTYSPWGSYTNSIGVNFINLTGSNIKLDSIMGFTMGCQLTSNIECAYNNFYVAEMLDNQRAFNFVPTTPGFVNENVFVGGNYAVTSNISKPLYNCQSRWAVYGSTTSSLNQNVFYKPCFQLGAPNLLTSTSINTLNNLVGGSSYTNGTYPNVSLTGGTGSGATATITVAGNTVTSVALALTGTGYAVGDSLSATIAGGSGFSIAVASLAVGATGIGKFTLTAGSGYTTAGTYYNVPLIGGSGSNAAAIITINGGKITSVQLTTIGIGYALGDSLSALAANLGGAGSGFGMTVTTLTISPTTISTFTFTAGSGYTNGVYPGVSLSGGGSGAQVTITVSGGVISSVQLTSGGIGYKVNDSLSATFGGGTATSFLVVTSLTFSPTSLAAFTLTAGGTGYVNGVYTNVSLTGGTGSGAKATITVSGGSVSMVQPTATGIGYAVSDVLSASASDLGGTGSGFSITVTNTSGSAVAVPAYLDGAAFFAFNNCRVESCSNTIAQVRNGSRGNTFSIDYLNNLSIIDPVLTIDDTSSIRNTIIRFNWTPEADATATLVYQSPFLVDALSPYGTNTYNIKGLDWVKRADGTVANGSTLTSIGPDYIELSASDNYLPAITFNTVAAKRFMVKFDTVSFGSMYAGYGGRLAINCYDITGNIIDPTTLGSPVIWTYGTVWATYGANNGLTLYGKAYALVADLNPYLTRYFYFNVDSSVAHVRLIFINGTQNLRLKQFSVYALDNRSQSGYTQNIQTNDFLGFASAAPTLKYPQGTFVKNDFSVDTSNPFWYNTTGLSTGWKAANDYNNLANVPPIYIGTGTPNGTVTASPGSLYLNLSGGANTTLWVKESGTGNTGWVAK